MEYPAIRSGKANTSEVQSREVERRGRHCRGNAMHCTASRAEQSRDKDQCRVSSPKRFSLKTLCSSFGGRLEKNRAKSAAVHSAAHHMPLRASCRTHRVAVQVHDPQGGAAARRRKEGRNRPHPFDSHPCGREVDLHEVCEPAVPLRRGQGGDPACSCAPGSAESVMSCALGGHFCRCCTLSRPSCAADPRTNISIQGHPSSSGTPQRSIQELSFVSTRSL